MTDRFGRKKLFLITLAVYLLATVATAFAESFAWFAICRFFTGAGIGGEYAAINSAIDELIPARVRGTIDLVINGSFWLGTAFGAALSIVLLNESIFPADVGWRIAFGLGAVIGIGVLIVRRLVPESPRWLILHGRDEEAERIVGQIEDEVQRELVRDSLPDPKGEPLRLEQRGSLSLARVTRAVFGENKRRTFVGLSLFIGQAFLYNAVFFTYGLVLGTFFDVPADHVGWYIIPFALGNFLGPLTLGRLFDSVGRKPMIATCYIVPGLLLVVTGFLFRDGVFGAWGLTAAWSVIFFFASAGASSAYLTVSEIFPLETRALAISFFYAVGTAAGGITGPLLFGRLVESEEVDQVFAGWLLGAALMIVAGVVQAIWGIEAARRKLEDVATPLSAQTAPSGRRRRRLGPSPAQPSYSPLLSGASRREGNPEIEDEVAELVATLTDAGEAGLGRRELGVRVHCRQWGPGRFRAALGEAVGRGLIRRSARGRYVAIGAGEDRFARAGEPAPSAPTG
jgi:MFS family permease